MRKVWIHGAGLVAALAVAAPGVAEAQGRYTGIDRNRDGVITRAEWPGNDTSFRQHDRNRDGLLSGVEVRSEWRRRDDNGNGRNKLKAKGTSGSQHHGKAKGAKPVKPKKHGKHHKHG
jgi:hypothetical protein